MFFPVFSLIFSFLNVIFFNNIPISLEAMIHVCSHSCRMKPIPVNNPLFRLWYSVLLCRSCFRNKYTTKLHIFNFVRMPKWIFFSIENAITGDLHRWNSFTIVLAKRRNILRTHDAVFFWFILFYSCIWKDRSKFWKM